MSTIAIDVPRDQIPDFCLRYKVRRLSLFGSVIHDDFTPESDVDVLVELEPDVHMTFSILFDMEDELSVLFGGRKIDVNTPNSLSKYFRDEVVAEAEVLYVAP
jgi:predicted nucleotidyltransferase